MATSGVRFACFINSVQSEVQLYEKCQKCRKSLSVQKLSKFNRYISKLFHIQKLLFSSNH